MFSLPASSPLHGDTQTGQVLGRAVPEAPARKEGRPCPAQDPGDPLASFLDTPPWAWGSASQVGKWAAWPVAALGGPGNLE